MGLISRASRTASGQRRALAHAHQRGAHGHELIDVGVAPGRVDVRVDVGSQASKSSSLGALFFFDFDYSLDNLLARP